MTTRQWQLAESLFHAALELPPAERAGWLAQACPDDPTIPVAVLRMLEADAVAGDEIRRAVRFAVKQWMAQ